MSLGTLCTPRSCPPKGSPPEPSPPSPERGCRAACAQGDRAGQGVVSFVEADGRVGLGGQQVPARSGSDAGLGQAGGAGPDRRECVGEQRTDPDAGSAAQGDRLRPVTTVGTAAGFPQAPPTTGPQAPLAIRGVGASRYSPCAEFWGGRCFLLGTLTKKPHLLRVRRRRLVFCRMASATAPARTAVSLSVVPICTTTCAAIRCGTGISAGGRYGP
jgi:hypothetical protein